MSDYRSTKIEEELRWLAKEYYSDDIYEDKEAQRQFLLDIMGALRIVCGEY